MHKLRTVLAILALAVFSILPSMAQTNTTPADLTNTISTAQSNVVTYILQVAPPVFIILAVMIGLGLAFRWIKRASKAS